MKNKIILMASQLLFASSLMAGGTSGGTPPAMNLEGTLEDVTGAFPGSELGGSLLGAERIEELLSKLPSKDLIKTTEGKTLIPLSAENIRRLNIRTSTGIEASITTDKGEVFRLRRDLSDRLIDKKKLAEVIEKLQLENIPTDAPNDAPLP